MRQIKFSASDFVPSGESGLPDAVMDPTDLAEIQALAGIPKQMPMVTETMNISHTAMQRVEYMKTHDIKPGTEDWFRLWFSLPYLTGNNGMKK